MRRKTRFLAGVLCAALTMSAGLGLGAPIAKGAQAPSPPVATAAPRYNPAKADAWFYGQRLTPGGTVPTLAYAEARRQARALAPATGRFSAAAVSPTLARWTNLGPAPITGESDGSIAEDPASGRVSSIAISSRGTLYIGSAGGGVWSSNNSGTSWQPLTDSQDSLAMGAVAVDPNHPDIIYAGTGEAHHSDSFYGGGLLKSADAGATWSTIGHSHFGGHFISAVIVSPTPADGSNLFVADDLGVYHSTDGGRSWSLAQRGAVTDLALKPDDPQTLYAAVDRAGIYKSSDGGSSWNLLGGGLPAGGPAFGSTALAIAPSSPSTMYASIGDDTTDTLAGLYVTTDGGASWNKLTAPDYTGYAFFYGSGNGGQSSYDNVVAVSPKDPNVICAGGVGLTCSTDGGATWSTDLASANHLHPDFHALTFDSNGNLYIGNDGGVWMRDSAGQFHDLNHNLSITQFYPGMSAYVSGGQLNLVAGAQDNGTAQYSGTASWAEILGGDGAATAVDPGNPNLIYASYTRGAVRKSIDGGKTWSPFLPIGNTNANWVAPLVLAPDHPSTLYFGGENVYKSTDGGSTWTRLTDLALDFPSNPPNVSALTIAPGHPQVVYAGLNNGWVMVSTDSGAHWHYVSYGLPERWVTSVAVSPTNVNTAYVTLSGYDFPQSFVSAPHVFKTDDAGDSLPVWTDITGNLPGAPVNSLVDTGTTLIAASDVGVFSSKNGGQTWTTLGQGLPNTQVVEVKLSPDGQTLFASTHGRGIWSLPVGSLSTRRTAVTGLDHNSGPGSGGDRVQIYGAGFTGATAVNFGSVLAQHFTVIADNRIDATSPAGGGVVDVTVTGSGGMSATTGSDRYTYTGTPVLSSVTPATGARATEITLTGSGFGTGMGTVIFSADYWAVTVTPTGWTDTQVTATVPDLLQGQVHVQLIGSTGRSNDVTFTVAYGPVVTGVSPAAAPPGTDLTISGVHFGADGAGRKVVFSQGDTRVTAATATWSDTSVTATVPASLTPGKATFLVQDANFQQSTARPFVVLGATTQVTVTPAVASTAADGHTAVPITVKVTDTAGNGVPDVTVNLTSANTTVAMVTPAVITTGADGSYTATATVGTVVGPTQITAAVPSGPSGVASLNTYALGSPQTLTLTAPVLTVAPGGKLTLSGTVKDVNGSPVPSTAVALSASPGTLSSTAVTSGPDGSYTVDYTAPATSPFIATITATAGSGSTTATITSTAGAPKSVTLTPAAATAVVGTVLQVTATVTDAGGTPVPGVLVGLVPTRGTADASPAVTDATGSYTFSVHAPTTPGSVTLTAAVPGTGVAGSASITVNPGPPAIVTLTPTPATVTVGSSVSLSGRVTDTYGNGLSTATVDLGTTAGTISRTSVPTAPDGAYTAVLLTPFTPGSVTVTATVRGTAIASNTTVSVLAPPPAPLPLPPPPGAPVGGAVTVAVASASISVGQSTAVSGRAINSMGVGMPGIQVSLTASAGTISPSTVTTGGDGAFSATFTAGKTTGSVTISARGQDLTGSATLTVVGGPAAAISVKTGAASVAAGGTATVSGSVTDASGNPVTGAQVALSASGGAISPASVSTGSDGTYTATLTAPVTTGTVTVTATAGSASGNASIQVTAGPPAAIQLSASAGSVHTGAPVALTGKVTDAHGNPVAGASVVLSASSGTIDPATVRTGADGGFSTTLTAPAGAGTVTIAAASQGASGSASVTVTANAAAPPPVVVTTTVDTSKGTVTVAPSDHAVAVVLPPNSLPAGTTVQISQPAAASVPPAPSGASVVAVWSIDTGGVQPTRPVQLTFHYQLPPGVAPEQLGVYLLVNGNWQWVAAGQLDTASGTITVTVPHFSTWAVMANQQTYSDVPTSHWAVRDIADVSARGIASGFPDGTFRPDEQVTRAQFLKLLLSTLGIEPKVAGQQPFTDVAPTAWYAGYVDAAAAAGIFKGDGDLARPDDPITRQEVAVITVRAMYYAHLTSQTGAQPVPRPFADQDQIAAWARDAAQQASQFGVLRGYPDGTFQPARPVTRAEGAALMVRLLQLKQNQYNPPQ